MKPGVVVIAFGLALGLAAPANALCMYKGLLYAKTTLDQEFANAPFVVKGRVVSSKETPGTKRPPSRGRPWALQGRRVGEGAEVSPVFAKS